MNKTIRLLFVILSICVLVIVSCVPEEDESGDIITDGGETTFTWTFIDGNAAGGLNINSEKSATDSMLINHNSTLFATWSENNSSDYSTIRVKKRIGDSWVLVDDATGDGINRDSAHNAYNPKLGIHDSALYLVWSEQNASFVSQIRVAKWDDPSWTFIGSNDENNGINANPGYSAEYPNIASIDSKLYVTWREYDVSDIAHVRVAKWDDPTWTMIDGTNDGLNINAGKNAQEPFMIAYNSKLYVAFVEDDASDDISQARVKQYDVSNDIWTFVDGSDPLKGINFYPTEYAYNVSLYVFNSSLFATWVENVGASIGTIRVAKWDGSSTWEFVDGNTPAGLRYDSTKSAIYPSLIEINSRLVAVWSEDNGTDNQIRAARWDNVSTWTFMDGNASNGLNWETDAWAYSPKPAVMNSKLFITWVEDSGGSIGRIRVRQGE
ncbi:hypothetical protein KKA14_17700 [bacterium]|nr:hypothetical protein [bacterium]